MKLWPCRTEKSDWTGLAVKQFGRKLKIYVPNSAFTSLFINLPHHVSGQFPSFRLPFETFSLHFIESTQDPENNAASVLNRSVSILDFSLFCLLCRCARFLCNQHKLPTGRMARAVFNRLVHSFETSTLTKMEIKARSTHLKRAVQKEERADFQGLILIPVRRECFPRSEKADLESRPFSNIARKQSWNSGRWSSVWHRLAGSCFFFGPITSAWNSVT